MHLTDWNLISPFQTAMQWSKLGHATLAGRAQSQPGYIHPQQSGLQVTSETNLPRGHRKTSGTTHVATKAPSAGPQHPDVKVTQVFHCPHCNKKSPTYAAHQRHIFSKHDTASKSFECPTCHKSYLHEISLTEHMKKHQGIFNFTCEDCGAGFGRKFQLEGHIASKHRGIDLYTCPISSCRKGFGYKGNYEAHLRKAHPDHNVI